MNCALCFVIVEHSMCHEPISVLINMFGIYMYMCIYIYIERERDRYINR